MMEFLTLLVRSYTFIYLEPEKVPTSGGNSPLREHSPGVEISGFLSCNNQTRETVFHQDIQTPKRELKIRHAAEYF